MKYWHMINTCEHQPWVLIWVPRAVLQIFSEITHWKLEECFQKYALSPCLFDCRPCGFLVPWTGIEPMPPALEVWSINHWTAKEVPPSHIIMVNHTYSFISLRSSLDLIFQSKWFPSYIIMHSYLHSSILVFLLFSRLNE